MTATWETLLPGDIGALPLGGRLWRTDPAGPAPSAVAVVGLYPAHVRTGIYVCRDGTRLKVPVEVERRSFEGSRSGLDLEERYMGALGLERDKVFFIDLYPYFLANTAPAPKSGRSMWDNVRLYEDDSDEELAVKERPEPEKMIAMCREKAGNVERLADLFGRCRPRLVITLGAETAAFARGCATAQEGQRWLYAPPIETAAFGWKAPVVHCAHPGVFARRTKANPWVARHAAWCADVGVRLVAEASGKGAA